MAYYESGQTIQHTLVFLHALSASSKTWQSVFESHLKDSYRLVALDLPGHGLSSPAQIPEEMYHLPAMTKYLSFAIEALGIL
jgi:pimeloyl-ACP methyl ester carboxylesterase